MSPGDNETKAHAITATASAQASATVGIQVTRGSDDRPWDEKWLFMKRYLETLEELTTRAHVGVNELEDAVNQFFGSSQDMKDWLKQDKKRLPNLVDADVERYFWADQDLVIGSGLANTWKHRERTPTKKDPDPIKAIIKTLRGHSPVGAEIEYTTAASGAQTVDALSLARRCFRSWQTFLQQQGISEP